MDRYSSYPRPPQSALPVGMVLGILVVLAILSGLGVASIVAWIWPGRHSQLRDPQAEMRPVAARGDLAADEQSTIALFREVSPSVVYITTSELRRDEFSFNLQEIPTGTGSGFIWNDQGHIVTNFHVIQGASTAKVTLADHSTWQARLVGVEEDKDLAVLKIDAPHDRLQPILIGSSADLQVGQKVFAIGNPFGLDQTLTTGVISGLGREIMSVTKRPIQGVIQTDAAINPGNSGGPLLDSAGRLIGVNTAIYSPSGTYAGVGFAVPVDTVNRVVPQILRAGQVTRPRLGVMVFEDRITDSLGLKGALVRSVLPGSPAEKSGLQGTRSFERLSDLGDLIVAVDDRAVNRADDLYLALDEKKVGDTVRLTVVRNGQRRQLPLTLEAVKDVAK